MPRTARPNRTALALAALALALACGPATAHAAPAEEDVVFDCFTMVEDDGLAEASACLDGPADYTGPATVHSFYTGQSWTCESVQSTVAADQDDPEITDITTSGCTPLPAGPAAVDPGEDDDPGDDGAQHATT
ncbi:hypothetical protein [Kitasatospora sp. NPDC058478]|uniref:hypothetical protein n=1 Tax=unclassified Kitasatospora TaxID=2633591 RepID=UPI003663448B